MSEETTTKKTTQKKAQPKKPAKPKVISFFFPKGNHSVFVWGRSDSDGVKARSVTARVESSMIRVMPDALDGEFIIKKLRADVGNAANGGSRFEEVETGIVENSSIANRIDQLNSMDKSALVALLGGSISLNRLTTGALIAKALELE